MWIPAIKVGDKKWLLSTSDTRRKFMEVMETAVLCDEIDNGDGTTSLMFCSDDKEENASLVQAYTGWFGVYTHLKKQFDITRAKIENLGQMARAGIRGIVKGGNDGEVSH